MAAVQQNDFPRALKQVLKYEGGYVNHPADPGGATNKGITQAVYNAWRKARKQPVQSVRAITDAEVSAIYEQNYWKAAGCDRMKWPLNLVAFDVAVNMGVGRIAQFLAQARAHMDTNPLNDHLELSTRVLELRTTFYYNLVKARPQMGVFLRGWLNRVRDLRTVAGLK